MDKLFDPYFDILMNCTSHFEKLFDPYFDILMN